MKKRVFFAIDLPEKVKNSFTELFEHVGNINEVKWEKPEKLHLTLIFLGYVEEKKIQQITILLDRIKVEHQQLKLRVIPKISAFPTLSNPRVLWLPIEGDIHNLQNIAQLLTKTLEDKGFHFDNRTFSAHLTIGRFRGGIKKWEKQETLETIVKSLPKDAIEFTVNKITLFESKLTPKGSLYNILAYENFGN